MRKWIRRSAYILVWLFIFCFALNKISNWCRYKVRAGDVVKTFFDYPEKSFDVLFMGSSMAYRGISPMELWEQNGITSYILGTPSQHIPCSYYLIEEAIAKQKPKVIVLDVYGAQYKKFYKHEARFRQAIDDIPWGRTRIRMVTEMLSKAFPDLEERLEYIFPFIKYHSRWSSLNLSDFIEEYGFMRGYTASYYTDNTEAVRAELPDTQKAVWEENEQYLQRIIDLCRENDIGLVFIRTPMAEFRSAKKILAKENTALALGRDNGLDVIDFQEDETWSRTLLDAGTDFFDEKHLNSNGAIKISRYLGNYLEQNYGLEDHSGEEKYRYWHDDYQLYAAHLGYLKDNITHETENE